MTASPWPAVRADINTSAVHLLIMSKHFPNAGKTIAEKRFCRSSGAGLDGATVSVAEVIRYILSDGYVSIRYAANYLGVSRRFLESRLAEIPHYRPGRKNLFKISYLDRWIKQYRQEPMSQKNLKAMVDEVVQAVLSSKPKASEIFFFRAALILFLG